MSNAESQPKPNVDEIKGDYIDVSIIEPADFRSYLETETSFRSLYSSIYAKELPHPVYDAQIGYVQTDGDVGIEGDLHFRPSAIYLDDTKPWQDILNSTIKGILVDNGYDTYTLPHELYALHIPLSADYVAHLKLTSETHQCCVELSLERIYELEHELGEKIATTLPETPDTYKLFKDFTTIWASTIDAVVNEYGHQKKKKPVAQITLTAPRQPQSVHTAEEVAEQQGMLESSFPEIERHASSRQSFRMLGGLEYPKQQLQNIVDTFNDPVGAKMYGISASHFMLYGPSGTGKTSLVEALTGEITGAALQHVASSDIMTGVVGQSGTNLAAIFDEAFSHTEPYILFFDEFDAIAGKDNNDSVSHVEVKKLLNQYIIAATKNHPNIIIAAATNLDHHQIEDSLIRSGRLKKIGVALPSANERSDIWAAVLTRSFMDFTRQTTIAVDSASGDIRDDQQFIPYAEDIDPTALSLQTDGMTGADFEQILLSARHTCYKHYKQTGESRQVGQADLIQAIQEFNY